jgi:hypothetical protein
MDTIINDDIREKVLNKYISCQFWMFLGFLFSLSWSQGLTLLMYSDSERFFHSISEQTL